jgi:hypothetical protein
LKPGWKETSPAARSYNCHAWAAGDTTRRWDPDAFSHYYWPPTVPRQYSVERFTEAYVSIGYEVSADGDHEAGFQKIAIYADANGKVTHSARRLANGKWTSKLGYLEDIRHETPQCLHCATYATVVRFLRRKVPT